MNSGHTVESLAHFEEEIKESFLQGRIRAPVHLSGSVDGAQERALIEIFKVVRPGDWVFATHRSHFHALLRGLPANWVKSEILAGRSMHLMNAEHRFFSSAIVGGCLPIALGVALGIKLRGGAERVWACVGDMAATGGLFHECKRYAAQYLLPITFIVENNGLSVNTPTEEVWGGKLSRQPHVLGYSYTRLYPHIGVGEWVVFS